MTNPQAGTASWPNATAATLASGMLFGVVGLALYAPVTLATALDWLNGAIMSAVGAGYVWLLALTTLLCAVLLLWPSAAQLRLGRSGDQPEYSFGSWVAMMYGAGLSAALIKWSIAEPVEFMHANPDLIQQVVAPDTAENMRMAMKWAFLHWGFGAWSSYAVLGLALAFVCHRRGLPLNLVSPLRCFLGDATVRRLSTPVNALTIVLCVICVMQILHFSIDQVHANLALLGSELGVAVPDASATTTAVMAVVAVGLGALCIATGLRHGVRWMANSSLVTSAVLLTLLLTASSFNGFKAVVICITDYLVALPDMAVRIWRGDAQAADHSVQLSAWQLEWSLFHWTWWIPFTVFVGLFMARISRGRTVREFVLGAMVVPSFLCWVWLTWAGGTAIDLAMHSGNAAFWVGVENDHKLFVLIANLFSPEAAIALNALVAAMFLMYSITSVNAALWVVSGLATHGRVTRTAPRSHLYWAAVLAGLVWVTHHFGAVAAIQALACVAALPVSVLIAANALALCKGVLDTTGAPWRLFARRDTILIGGDR
ncbi:MAG: BCCT family transporter [Pseudomonadota bacterium]